MGPLGLERLPLGAIVPTRLNLTTSPSVCLELRPFLIWYCAGRGLTPDRATPKNAAHVLKSNFEPMEILACYVLMNEPSPH